MAGHQEEREGKEIACNELPNNCNTKESGDFEIKGLIDALVETIAMCWGG